MHQHLPLPDLTRIYAVLCNSFACLRRRDPPLLRSFISAPKAHYTQCFCGISTGSSKMAHPLPAPISLSKALYAFLYSSELGSMAAMAAGCTNPCSSASAGTPSCWWEKKGVAKVSPCTGGHKKKAKRQATQKRQKPEGRKRQDRNGKRGGENRQMREQENIEKTVCERDAQRTRTPPARTCVYSSVATKRAFPAVALHAPTLDAGQTRPSQ